MRIVGMFWNYNEADILPQTLEAALPHVDSMFIADDGSKDNSWDIIRGFAERHKDKVEHIQQKPNKKDKAQRESVLTEIKKRYDDKTWVQIMESDVMILDTDLRIAIKEKSVENVAVSWQLWNAIRKDWMDGSDTYPNWNVPIKELMPYGHYMECMLYTFRCLPDLHFNQATWRPWPAGFSKYVNGQVKQNKREPDTPLLAHVGFRGPTHFYEKYKYMGSRHKKYKDWDLTSVESVNRTVFFFNGLWNKCHYDLSREGWCKWNKTRWKKLARRLSRT